VTKKILIVYSDPNCSCTKKSTFELAKGFSKFTETNTIYHKDLNDNVIAAHAIIIFQRLGANAGIITPDIKAKIFNFIDTYKFKKLFVYDIDDLILESQNCTPIDFIKKVDVVAVPNENYLKHIFTHNPNVILTRTFVDIEEIKNIKNDLNLPKDRLNLLWASTGALGKDLMKNLIPEITKQFPTTLIHCLGRIEFSNFKNTKCYPIQPYPEFVKFCKACDIILNPISYDTQSDNALIARKLKDTTLKDFIDCKSEIKYAHAGICKTPIISSVSSSYKYAIKNKINGFLAENLQDWIDAISLLTTEKALKNKIVNNAYDDVLNNYSLSTVSQRIYNDLEKQFDMKKGAKIYLEIIQNESSDVLGEITPRKAIIQKIKCTKPNLFKIDFFGATFARVNRCSISCKIVDSSNGVTVRAISQECDFMSDNAWFEFIFEPIRDSENKNYDIVLESLDSSIGNAVTVYRSVAMTNPDKNIGDLFINNFKVRGQLKFRTFHKNG